LNSAAFVRSNLAITFLSLASVGANFINQMVLAYYFGAKAERDAYFSAMAIPTYLVALFVGSFSVILLPFYLEFRKKHSDSDAVKFASSTVGVCILLFGLVAILGFVFSNQIIQWTAPGYGDTQLALAVNLFRILIFTVLFQSLSSLLTDFTD
jgi:putative peptidoglycan lipid II flippase